MIDLCLYCVIMIQDPVIYTRVTETQQDVNHIEPLNVDKLCSGQWHVTYNSGAHGVKALPLIAVCTGPGGIRLCSLHAMTESRDPRNRHPYPDRANNYGSRM